MNFIFLGGKSPEVEVHDVDSFRWLEHGDVTVIRFDVEAAYLAGGIRGLENDLKRLVVENQIQILVYPLNVVVSVMPRYVIETAAFAFMLGLAVYLSHKLGGWQTAAPLLAFYVFAAYRLLPQVQQIYVNAMLVQQNARIVEALAELTASAKSPSAPREGDPAGSRPIRRSGCRP